MSKTIDIISVALGMPKHVRTNDYWPPSVVESWGGSNKKVIPDEESFEFYEKRLQEPLTEGMKMVIRERKKIAEDPFEGSVKRHILANGETLYDIEELAARRALENAGLPAKNIDLLITASMIPEEITINHQYVLHNRLGLRPDVLSFPIDCICNSFLMQLDLAKNLLIAKGLRYALLVQSTGVSRLARLEEPASPWWGDGATAVIVTVSEKGLVDVVHQTDSSMHDVFHTGSPQQKWYDSNKPFVYVDNALSALRMLLKTPDFGKIAFEKLMQKSGIQASQIDFYASHQASVWFTRISQEYMGLNHAKSYSTFPDYASMNACNIPCVLFEASSRGLLKKGDLVAAYSGSAGVMFSSAAWYWSI